MATKHEEAQAAVQAYTAYVCGSVGRSFDPFKADMMALDAAEKLEAAAKQERPAFRAVLRSEAAEFWAIASEVV